MSKKSKKSKLSPSKEEQIVIYVEGGIVQGCLHQLGASQSRDLGQGPGRHWRTDQANDDGAGTVGTRAARNCEAHVSIPNLDLLVMLDSDDAIKRIIVENGITVPNEPPRGPNDTAFFAVNSGGYRWLIIRFYDPEDPGYLAYGLPLTLTQEEMKPVFQFVIDGFEEEAKTHGVANPWEYSHFTNFPQPQAN